MKEKRDKRKPNLFEALSILFVMVGLFAYSFIGGFSTVSAVILALAYSTLIAWRCGYTWKELEEPAGEKIKKCAPAMLILLCVGVIIGTWMYSGTIPMIIYYGVKFINERWIIPCAFILCAVFALATGTSNGSASTAGLCVMGIAAAMQNVNVAAVAGACYSGCMLGDKLSPLSDSTSLCSVATGNELFDHIGHNLKTALPAAGIALLAYIFMGFNVQTTGGTLPADTQAMLASLEEMFNFNIILLLPLVVVVWGVVTKKSSSLTMILSAIVAILLGAWIQGFHLSDGIDAMYSGFTPNIVVNANAAFNVETISGQALTIVKRGGLTSMLKPYIICYIAFYLASQMDQIGVIDVILRSVMAGVHNRVTLILATALSGILLIAVSGGSTLAIVMSGELFNAKYEEMGLHTINLSRAVSDFCVGMAGFIPWTSSGILYAAIFGANCITFLPYCIFTWASWVFCVLFAITGFSMRPVNNKTKEALS